jgi:hypothetical protein
MISPYLRPLCGAALFALTAGCGGSKPIQEEPNAPSGGSPTVPGPQTEDPSAPTPDMETPDTEPPSAPEPTGESSGTPPTP